MSLKRELGILSVVISLLGTKQVRRLQVVLVLGLLAIMLLYVVRGLPAIKLGHLEPFAPNGFESALFMAGFVFVAYGGLLKTSSVSEESRDPGRVIPPGVILSLVVVILKVLDEYPGFGAHAILAARKGDRS